MAATPSYGPQSRATDAPAPTAFGAPHQPIADAGTTRAARSDLTKECPHCRGRFADDVMFCAADGTPLRKCDDEMQGRIIGGRYRVERMLGKGATGTVYLAQHVRMRRWSALKVIGRSALEDTDVVSRFHREAANASQIAHPNVAAVYDFGEDQPEILYLAMEFVDGEPLHSLLTREGALSIPRSVELLRQAAAGLTAAHDLHIVHRDLKPDNIMIRTNRDGSEVVKIVDFGIARVFGADSQRVTRTGLVVGTPAYMSPEQLTASPIDVRTDIYSLALVGFRMLTGTLPFHGKSAHEMMLARLTRPPQTLIEARDDIVWPEGLQAVFDRALAGDADARYQTAGDFAAALVWATIGIVPADQGVALGGFGVAGPSAAVPSELPSTASPPNRPEAPTVVEPPPARARTRRRLLSPVLSLGVVAAIGSAVLVWRERVDGVSDPGPANPSGRIESTGVADTQGVGTQPAGRRSGADSPSLRPPPVQRSATAPAGQTPMLDEGTRLQGEAERLSDSLRVAAAAVADSVGMGASDGRSMKVSGGEAATAMFDATDALDSLKAWTDPATPTDDRARQALRSVAVLLPRLTRKADSVSASYYAALARLHLEDTAGACRILQSIRPDASVANLTRAIDALLTDAQVGCR